MTITEQLAIMNAYKDGKQIYRCRKYTSGQESEKIPLYTEENPHDFDFHGYTYSLHGITWKDFSQEEAFRYRLWYEYCTYRDDNGDGYVTTEIALKLFNDGVEYGKHHALKTGNEANDEV